MTERPADPLAGQVLGGTYRLVRAIGEGGMGTVYEAEHTRLNKRFAIKTLHQEIGPDSEAYQRFRREAEIVSELGHPHIVEVIDFDHSAEGRPYMVMEHLQGEELDAVLEREGRLGLDRLVRIVREVGSALQAAHERGIVHRDLKPENIYLCRFGERQDFPKILDFGISKIQGAVSIVTQQNAYLGTAAYMSPEQAEGRAAEADARSDVWALGAIIYRALSGRDAFCGDGFFDVLDRIVKTTPTPLHRVEPELPREVSDVVRRAMYKDPEARFASAADLAAALVTAAGAAAGLPSVALDPGHGPLEPGGGESVDPRAPTAEIESNGEEADEEATRPMRSKAEKYGAGSSRQRTARTVSPGGGGDLVEALIPQDPGSAGGLPPPDSLAYSVADLKRRIRPRSHKILLLVGLALLALGSGAAIYIGFLRGETRPLHLQSIPTGAEVIINGRHLGACPLGGVSVPTGALHILLEKQGFRPWEQRVEPGEAPLKLGTIRLQR